MPKLTAVLEAAVAVMYEYMEDSVQLEIDCPELSEDHPTWRELVLAACRETGMDEDDELPDADSEQVGEWEVLIQCLSDRVLWDNDWMDGDLFLDSDPEGSGVLKRLQGIDDDYYTAIPPDCTGEELEVYHHTVYFADWLCSPRSGRPPPTRFSRQETLAKTSGSTIVAPQTLPQLQKPIQNPFGLVEEAGNR